MSSSCVLIVFIVAVILIVYGFLQVFGGEKPTENDTQVLQRQLRGFALIILAGMLLSVGVPLCIGKQGLMDMVRNVRSSDFV